MNRRLTTVAELYSNDNEYTVGDYRGGRREGQTGFSCSYRSISNLPPTYLGRNRHNRPIGYPTILARSPTSRMTGTQAAASIF